MADADGTSGASGTSAAPLSGRHVAPAADDARDTSAASPADPFTADLRAPGEDDDGYDPYSDYMDAWGRAGDEEPCEDPWR